MMALKKCETGKKCMDCSLFSDTSHLMMLVCLVISNPYGNDNGSAIWAQV